MFSPKTSSHKIRKFLTSLSSILIKTTPSSRSKFLASTKPWVNHTAPVGMKSPIAFGVTEQAVTVLVVHARFLVIFLATLRKIVTVYKVTPGVIWRIYINHFNFTKIAFLQEFQRIEIITFNVKVLRCIPVFYFLPGMGEASCGSACPLRQWLIFFLPM